MRTILLLLLLQTSPIPEDAPKFGVAGWMAGGVPCVTFREEVDPGTRVTVTHFEPDRVRLMTVGALLAGTCHESAQLTGFSYALDPEGGAPGADVGIAVIGSAEKLSFRVCASAEGLHLTAWSGLERVWHAYYYSGYDLDPDCTDPETRDEDSH